MIHLPVKERWFQSVNLCWALHLNHNYDASTSPNSSSQALRFLDNCLDILITPNNAVVVQNDLSLLKTDYVICIFNHGNTNIKDAACILIG